MNKRIFTSKYRILCLSVFLTLLIAASMCLMHGFTTAQAATSGPVVDHNVEDIITVNLDVNGKSGGTTEGDETSFAANNNSAAYRRRTISDSVLMSNRTDMDGYTLVAAKTGDTFERVIFDNSASYTIAASTGAYTSEGYYFDISTNRTNVTGGVRYTNVTFTAKRATSSLDEKALPRIALVYSKTGNEDKIVMVRLRITASFPTYETDTSKSEFYVGRQLKADATEELEATAAGYKNFPLHLKNYETVDIDLDECLANRKLYAVVNTSAPADRIFKDATTGSVTLKAEQDNGVLYDTDAREYLRISDLSDYHITDVSSIGSLVKIENVRYYTEGNSRRSFTVDIEITPEDLINPGNFRNGKLWANDGAAYELVVSLAHNRTNNAYKIRIPVVFDPADKPRQLSVFKMDTSINAGSSYVCETDNNTTVSTTGFKTVRIRPAYLCEFPSYADDAMYFVASAPTPTTTGIVQIAVGGEGNDVYYDVTGVANGSTDVTFNVSYYSGGESHTIPVPVNFTVYGKYDIPLSVRGNNTHTYTIDSSIFAALKEAGYHIEDAKLIRLQETDAEYCKFGYESGTISLTPLNDLLYDDVLAVRVTLIDIEGHTIDLDCGVTIDVTAKDPFATWLTWQKVLFWVGIGLAVCLLILLIVWLFVRSIHSKKIDELEVSAPTSTYLIKLNSTIAAAQAQQKATSTPAPAAQGVAPVGPAPMPTAPGVMPPMPGALPGALPNTAEPAPGTLALGVTPQTSQPAYSSGTYSTTTGPYPTSGEWSNTTASAPAEDIYIPVSDEELLQRIYEEKFEPRGMLKRTFDKSKDLQRRELEKEKERIRELVRGGMSIEEACKSAKQREADAAFTTTDRPEDSQPVMQLDPLIVLLGFDPAEPIVSDVKPEPEQEDWADDVRKLKAAEYNNRRLHSELELIESRLAAVAAGTEKTESDIESAHAIVDNLTSEMRKIEQDLDDKNMALATERRKSAKEALNKEISDLDARIKASKDAITARRGDLETYSGLLARLKEVNDEYSEKKEATEALVASSDKELANAQEESRRVAELAERARKQAELNAKLEILNPMMHTVNALDDEIKELTQSIDRSSEEKDSLKTKVGALQTEMLSATDPAKITELNQSIKEYNRRISELDRAATANTSVISGKSIEMASARRKANEFIEKEEIELEDVIRAEDLIIGQLALDKLKARTDREKAQAEEAVSHWQAEVDSLVSNLDTMVMEAAAGVAARIKETEDALADAQAKLADIDAAIEGCENDDDKLTLTVEQMSLQEEVANLTSTLETMRAEGIKANLEFRSKGEEEIENARRELAHAQEDFERITASFNDAHTNVNPLDLITSGSGVISQDRKKIEAENLKKLLKESQNAAEQARLQAQMAQEEAERAVADARRASDESRAEAERLAQEAMEKAETARKEAEQRAQEEAERARQEAEEVKRQAQEEVENARRAAEEEAERARQEAEQRAQEEAERVRKEAEEHKRLAEEEAERVRKESEEETERMRQEMEEQKRLAEEEEERKRKEAEEEEERKRKEAEEEEERKRKEAEEEEERKRKEAEEEEKRKARIDEKVAKRKEEVAKLRDELKTITEEDQGAALREKFYQILLALDEEEKSSQELVDLLNKSMDDASHAAELSHYKKLADKKPRRIVKKVTERVNRVPRKKARPNGARRPGSAGASGAHRPAGARPSGARRPGSAGANGARRPAGARPSGARRPTNGVRRPTGSRPTPKK